MSQFRLSGSHDVMRPPFVRAYRRGAKFRDWPRAQQQPKGYVPISCLRRTQEEVLREEVELYRKRKHLEPIRVYLLPSGTWAIEDGHHRATAALLNGASEILAELDLPEQTSIPLEVKG